MSPQLIRQWFLILVGMCGVFVTFGIVFAAIEHNPCVKGSFWDCFLVGLLFMLKFTGVLLLLCGSIALIIVNL